jgi:hypothetical protein
VPSAPLCAQPAAKRRRHTECACYVDAFIRNSSSPAPRSAPWHCRENIAVEIKAIQRSRHTPCAVCPARCATRRGAQTAHGVCLLRWRLIRNSSFAAIFCWNSSHALWHATHRRLGSRHLRRTTREKATGYRRQTTGRSMSASGGRALLTCSLKLVAFRL